LEKKVKKEKNVLIFYLRNGILNVSLLNFNDTIFFKVKANAGDIHLRKDNLKKKKKKKRKKFFLNLLHS
jgi:hypothetical protein